MQIPLSSALRAKLSMPVRGGGGFQSLLRKLQRQITNGTIHVDASDVERLLRYSFQYGGGGFQERTKPAARATAGRRRYHRA